MPYSALEIDSLTHSYGNRRILSNVYFNCKIGDITGVLGRNGSGKSTLLKIIFGTVTPEFKHLRINNEIIDKPFQKGNLVAYLPENSFLPANISLNKIIDLFIKDQRIKNEIKQDTLINKYLTKKPMELSSGESRYFEILLIVNHPAGIILLDEPFSGIEPLLKEHIIQLIESKKDKKCFMIADHDYRNILKLCNRLILLTDQNCIEINEPSELKERGYLPERYV